MRTRKRSPRLFTYIMGLLVLAQAEPASSAPVKAKQTIEGLSDSELADFFCEASLRGKDQLPVLRPVRQEMRIRAGISI